MFQLVHRAPATRPTPLRVTALAHQHVYIQVVLGVKCFFSVLQRCPDWPVALQLTGVKTTSTHLFSTSWTRPEARRGWRKRSARVHQQSRTVRKRRMKIITNTSRTMRCLAITTRRCHEVRPLKELPRCFLLGSAAEGNRWLLVGLVAMSSKPRDPSSILETATTEGKRRRGTGKKKGKGLGKKRNPCLKKYKDFCIHGNCQYLRDIRAPSCVWVSELHAPEHHLRHVIIY